MRAAISAAAILAFVIAGVFGFSALDAGSDLCGAVLVALLSDEDTASFSALDAGSDLCGEQTSRQYSRMMRFSALDAGSDLCGDDPRPRSGA